MTITQSENQTAAKPVILTVELSYWDETTPNIPETLVLELTAEEVAAVHDARAFIARNSQIHTVNVRCTPPEIDGWRYDVCYLIVHKTVGCYLFLQGKYDCSEQVEYSVDI